MAGLFLLAVVLVVTTFHLPARKPGSQKATIVMKVDDPKVIADPGRVTKANFERIKKGMTFAEVCGILDRARVSGGAGNLRWMLYWWNNFPDDGAEITVQFTWQRDKQGKILPGHKMIANDVHFREGKEDVEQVK